ncbi:hypothetical protein [Labilibacter marinus]|uniref:hypothetical protein n=1 Tax=Labilibacter marinus TaxID=1477105 RepID=UPI00083012FD|nr:hypothetical protein [Labilibacter marinus]
MFGKQLYIVWSIGLLIPIFLGMRAGTPLTPTNSVIHEVEYRHPGNKDDFYTSYTLHELKGDDGMPEQFYIDVQSVICLEDVCQVVPVRLYWNNIGEYKKYELAEDISLEKGDGEFFEEKDYLLLDKILADNNSPFKTVGIDEIISSIPVHGEEVDGYSGATTLNLHSSESVEGAALTCFTLWHWANGSIQDSIRRITGDACNTQQLQELFQHQELAFRLFALEQMGAKDYYSVEFYHQLLSHTTIANSKEIKASLNYLEQGPTEMYFKSILEMVAQENKELRICALSSLSKYKTEVPLSTLINLSEYLSNFSSYREVNLLLSIIEEQKASSVQITEEAIKLLTKDILVARRAYWFLEDKSLTPSQYKVYKRFYKKNKEYL